MYFLLLLLLFLFLWFIWKQAGRVALNKAQNKLKEELRQFKRRKLQKKKEKKAQLKRKKEVEENTLISELANKKSKLNSLEKKLNQREKELDKKEQKEREQILIIGEIASSLNPELKNMENHYCKTFKHYDNAKLKRMDITKLAGQYKTFIIGKLPHHNIKGSNNIISSLKKKGLKSLGGCPKTALTQSKLNECLVYKKSH